MPDTTNPSPQSGAGDGQSQDLQSGGQQQGQPSGKPASDSVALEAELASLRAHKAKIEKENSAERERVKKLEEQLQKIETEKLAKAGEFEKLYQQEVAAKATLEERIKALAAEVETHANYAQSAFSSAYEALSPEHRKEFDGLFGDIGLDPLKKLAKLQAWKPAQQTHQTPGPASTGAGAGKNPLVAQYRYDLTGPDPDKRTAAAAWFAQERAQGRYH